MGVPVFFKWLTMRNPKILLDAKQPEVQDFNSGNPYIDNFYIDMNGLIHPSVNPKGESIKIPKNFQQQCQNIYLYMDKIMNIVRPKKFLYLAIDGVAPRAKMNQQRSRRFRAAMQGDQSKQQKQKLYEQFKKMQIMSPQIQQYVYKQSFDSNLITPGTIFLTSVSQRIRVYIKKKLANDKLWKNLIVVFSDANCPGQGEHKIMDFIRQQRASPNYNANQSHCIYGADADLIMLALATHEPRFFIIRQIVITMNDKWCTSCGKKGHFFTDCTAANSIQDQQRIAQKQNAQSIGVTFQFIKIKAVRQFIHVNYAHCTLNQKIKFDIQRVIDDFIFLCFFVGNDFLPHVPCLSIRQGGIDILMRVYEYCLKIMPDYITNVGRLNMKSLKIFIKQLSCYQPQLVSQLINKEQNQKQRQNFQKNVKPGMIKNLQQNLPNNSKKKKFLSANTNEQCESNIDPHDLLGSFKSQVQKRITPQINLDDYSAFNHDIFNYKEKYYSEKFRIEPKEFLQLKNSISKKYVQALQWICRYYYQGVPSWDWFYPFHYSPFLTDIDVPEENFVFEMGRPFKPYEQLMGVLPPKTYTALPIGLHHLMLDQNSPICDYFPSSFIIDIVGKKFAWLGEVLLPFIDSERLLNAMGNYQQNLTEQQRRLNKMGTNNVYISRYGELGRTLSNTQNLQLGQKIILSHQDHNLCGQIVLLMQYNQTSTFQFYFYQPWGLKHDISLKQGIQYNPLQQIDEDFSSRTDKRSYGGERFLRVIERSLGRRIQQERKKTVFNNRNKKVGQNQQQQEERGGSGPNARGERQPRDRSRDQYNNNNNYNNRRSPYGQRDQKYKGNNNNYNYNQSNPNNQQQHDSRNREYYDHNRSRDPRMSSYSNNQYSQQQQYNNNNNRYNNYGNNNPNNNTRQGYNNNNQYQQQQPAQQRGYGGNGGYNQGGGYNRQQQEGGYNNNNRRNYQMGNNNNNNNNMTYPSNNNNQPPNNNN